MTIHEAQQQLLFQLYHIYDDREAASITDWVMEHITGWKKIDRVLNKKVVLSQPKLDELADITQQLLAHKPVHYILQHAWFYGMKLFVNEHVLIPRPETEELVEWALDCARSLDSARSLDFARGGSLETARDGSAERLKLGTGSSSLEGGRRFSVLDVGTGSGCIPIALKKKMPSADVYACDISEGALEVAKRNAREQEVEIHFVQLDFLQEAQRNVLPSFDMIVSNPPYISEQEKTVIDKHVVEYEPHTALFVPESDPLVFYKHLAQFGQTHLQPHGLMLMEIHYLQGEAVRKLFEEKGYEVELKKDMQGNDRMIKVVK
jgi:release factor glutamine methyltransferase